MRGVHRTVRLHGHGSAAPGVRTPIGCEYCTSRGTHSAGPSNFAGSHQSRLVPPKAPNYSH
eukprot:747475-Amphidinium_carterae.1